MSTATTTTAHAHKKIKTPTGPVVKPPPSTSTTLVDPLDNLFEPETEAFTPPDAKVKTSKTGHVLLPPTAPAPPADGDAANVKGVAIATAAPATLAAPPANDPAAAKARMERAKKAFMESYKAPRPITRDIKSSGDSPTITVRGVVLRSKTVQIQGKKPGQTVPKLEIEVHPTKITSNNAPDVIAADLHGFEWLLPTSKVKAVDAIDAQEESADAKPDKGKRPVQPPRKLGLEPNHKSVNLDHISRVSFYKTGRDGADKDGMDMIVTGMPVEITGMVANLDDTGKVWLNASGVTPLIDQVPPGTAAELIIKELSKPEIAKTAAIKFSSTMRGFLSMQTFDNPHQEKNAEYWLKQWNSVVESTARACGKRAREIRSEFGPGGEELAAVMDAHEAEILSTSGADVAYGKALLAPVLPVTMEYPLYHAPLIVKGAAPWYPSHEWLQNLFEPGPARDAIPETFVAPEVLAKPEVSTSGYLLKVKMRLTWVHSKTDVIKAMERDCCMATINSHMDAAGVCMSVRELAKTVGVVSEPKALNILADIIQYGDWAVVHGVVPRDPSQENVFSNFPKGFVINVPISLGRISVPVTENFVKIHLAGGANQYVYEKDPDEQLLKLSDKVTDLTTDVTLASAGYQEITGSSFKFANARMPVGRTTKEYRVWWEGATDAIAQNPELVSDAALGEAELDKVRKTGFFADVEMMTFLLRFCTVYVVAKN